jgi:hypothetical protein
MLLWSHKLVKSGAWCNTVYIQPTYDRIGTVSDKGSPLLSYRLEYTLRDRKLPSTYLFGFLNLILVPSWYKLATLSYLSQEFRYPHKTSKTIARPNIHPKTLAYVHTSALGNMIILTLQRVSWCLSTSSLRHMCYGLWSYTRKPIALTLCLPLIAISSYSS